MTNDTMISKYFSLEECTTSSSAARLNIPNVVPDSVWLAMKNTAKLMDTVREMLQKPVIINSWYRSEMLNKAIGGVATSQHIRGEAVDFICPQFGTPEQICRYLASTTLSFDQLIFEHTWVHISFNSIPSIKNRKQVLTLLSSGGYSMGIINKR